VMFIIYFLFVWEFGITSLRGERERVFQKKNELFNDICVQKV